MLNVYIDDNLIRTTSAKSKDSPITIHVNKLNYSNKITFQIEEPKGYEILNWNKLDISELKIVEGRQNKYNNLKTFNFNLEKIYLERVYLDLIVSCDEINDRIMEPITIEEFIIEKSQFNYGYGN